MSDGAILVVVAGLVLGFLWWYGVLEDVIAGGIGSMLKQAYKLAVNDHDAARSFPADVGETSNLASLDAKSSVIEETPRAGGQEPGGRSPSAADLPSPLVWTTQTKPPLGSASEQLPWGLLVARSEIEFIPPETKLHEIIGFAAVGETPQGDAGSTSRLLAQSTIPALKQWPIRRHFAGMATMAISATRVCLAVDDPGEIDGKSVSPDVVVYSKIEYEHINQIWLDCESGRHGKLLPTSLHLVSDGSDGQRPFEIWFEVDGMRGGLIPRKVDGRAVYRDLVRAWAMIWRHRPGLDAARRGALERLLLDGWRRVDAPSGGSVFLVADAPRSELR